MTSIECCYVLVIYTSQYFLAWYHIIIGYAVLMTGCAPGWGSLCPWQSLRVQIQKAPAHRFFSTSTEQTSINSDWKRFSLFVGACLGHLVVNFYLPCLSSLFFLFLSSLIVHQRCLLCSLLRSQKYSQASPFPFPHRFFFDLSSLLVQGHKYPKMKGDHFCGGTDTHGCFAIYFFNPCFRALMAWDKYQAIFFFFFFFF